jgi:hypothetical protein
MRLDNSCQPETSAQWLEHSAAWRYAHLDQAPSEHFRRLAILEHERSLLGSAPADARTGHRWRHRRS